MDPNQLAARLRAFAASFTPQQLVTLVGAFILVVGVVGGSAWWLNQESYVLLFEDLDAESAGQMVSRLKTLNVSYQLDQGGRGIRVPAGRVDELRLELTAQGLPASGRVGFEIFDRTSFGATEFLEQVNYRRALEGEIARTIATLSEVASARVHIAMGKESLFGEPRPAKASVVLKLKGQRALPEPTIAGISNLVAASVEGLRPDAVVILDSFGRPLLRASDASDPLGAAQLDRQQRLERELTQRVVALLEPVVGQGRVRVNASVRLNPRSVEETEERWDPNTVVRTQQMSADGMTGGGGGGAVAGSRANAPAPAAGPDAAKGGAPATASAPMAPARTAETTTYEVSRTTRRSLLPAGEIGRLSMAVVLDDDQFAKKDAKGAVQVSHKARTHEELQKIHGLVAAAIGLDASRGDQLTIENVAFDEPLSDDSTPGVLQRYSPQIWEGSRMVIVGLLGLIALMVFVRPLLARAGVQAPVIMAAAAPVPAPLPAGGGLRTVAEIEQEIEQQLDAAAASRLEARKLPALTRRVGTMSAQNPENVAKLLRSWMAEQER